MRPWAKDNYTVFLGGIRNNVTQDELEEALSNYQPLLACSLLPSSSPATRNGTATFGSQEAFNRILIDYKDDYKLKTVFANQPYVTLHMNARDRQEYISFKKGKQENPRKPQQPPQQLLYSNIAMPMGMPGHVMNPGMNVPGMNGMLQGGMNLIPSMNMNMNMNMNRNFMRAHQNDI